VAEVLAARKAVFSCGAVVASLVQLAMDQRDHGQDVQSVLLGHVPIDLGVVGEGIADGAAETSQEAHEAPLLATLGLGLEGVDGQEGWTVLLAESGVDEIGTIFREARQGTDLGCDALHGLEDGGK